MLHYPAGSRPALKWRAPTPVCRGIRATAAAPGHPHCSSRRIFALADDWDTLKRRRRRCRAAYTFLKLRKTPCAFERGEMLADDRTSRLAECASEILTGGLHAHVTVQDDEGLIDHPHERIGVVLCQPHPLFRSLGHVNVEEREHRAIDLVVDALVWANAEREPASALVSDFALDRCDRIDRLEDQLLEIGEVDVRLDMPDRPIQIARDQIEDFLRHRREATDSQIARDDDNSDLNTCEKIYQVAVDEAQFFVPPVKLLVEG